MLQEVILHKTVRICQVQYIAIIISICIYVRMYHSSIVCSIKFNQSIVGLHSLNHYYKLHLKNACSDIYVCTYHVEPTW